jgi:hypothetical protein
MHGSRERTAHRSSSAGIHEVECCFQTIHSTCDAARRLFMDFGEECTDIQIAILLGGVEPEQDN